jgi:hypothetical protein
MNQDPFASVRLSQPQQQQAPQQQEQEQEQEDPFESVRIKKADENSGLLEVGRHAARIGSRIAETIGGIPGDVNSLIQSGLITGLDKLGVKPLSEEQEELYREQGLPSSAKLKKLSEEKTKGFTAPQDEYERFGDEIATTAASLLGPMKFRTMLGASAGAVAAKEGVKLLGLGEGPQEAAKLGTMLLITAMNPGGAMKYAGNQYEVANKLSKGVKLNVTPMTKELGNKLIELEKGFETSAKNAVKNPIEAILKKVDQSGKMPLQDLMASKRDLNTVMKDPILLKRERKLLKGVAKDIDNAIKPYEKINPAFAKAYRPANEIYSAVMQGTKANDFIVKNLGGKSILGAALAEVALGHPELAPYTLAGGAAIHGAAKAGDFFVRVAKSPELQKFYALATAAAIKEDLPALRLYADKIEENISKNRNRPDRALPNNRLKSKSVNR